MQGLAFVELDIGDLDVDRVDVRQQVGRALEYLKLEPLDVDLEQCGPQRWCRDAGIETFDGYLEFSGRFHSEDGFLARAQREQGGGVGAGGQMHAAFAGLCAQGAAEDFGLSTGDPFQLGSGLGKGLETDQVRLGPTGVGVDSKLSLVRADIDDGGEAVASEGGVVFQSCGYAVLQCRPAGRGLFPEYQFQ